VFNHIRGHEFSVFSQSTQQSSKHGEVSGQLRTNSKNISFNQLLKVNGLHCCQTWRPCSCWMPTASTVIWASRKE